MREVEARQRSLLNYSGDHCGCVMSRGRFEVRRTTRFERKDRILLGRNRRAISSSWLKAPILERRQALTIDLRAKALQHRLADNFPGLVNRDFDNHLALG